MRAFGVVGLVLLVSSPVSAAPFTWVVQGTVTRLDTAAAGPFASALHVGDTFDWAITLDSAAPDFDPSGACGQYTPILSMGYRSAAATLTQASAPGQDYLLKAATYTPASGCATLVPPDPNTARLRAGFDAGLFVALTLAGSFPTDALPTDPSTVRPLTSLEFFYAGFSNPIGAARVDAIRAVPEPAGTSLVVAGLLTAFARRWRRRNPSALPSRL